MTDPLDRLRAQAEARAAIINDIARILWENGEALADAEGGSMPTWDKIVDGRRAGTAATTDAYWSWFLDHTHRAEALMALQPADALTLAKHLIDSAMRSQEALELDLWGKVERARGLEAGSLTGAPGVAQRVAL